MELSAFKDYTFGEKFMSAVLRMFTTHIWTGYFRCWCDPVWRLSLLDFIEKRRLSFSPR